MKILVSGCSFTDQQDWPWVLFAPKKYDVINLGRWSAGNEYIANSVMYNIDQKPDFVFVLWSGLNRTEFRVPDSKIFANSAVMTYESEVIGSSRYFLNGHSVDPERGWLAGYHDVKADDWPDINSIQDWFSLPENIKLECLKHQIYLSSHGGKENMPAFCHQYFLTQHLDMNTKYRSERTFQNLVNCFNMLDRFGIPYRFSFIYDIFSEYHNHSLGRAYKEKYYRYVNWDKFINLPPYEYGIKHDLLDQEDNFHLTKDGMTRWGQEISKLLHRDKSLQYLFE